MKYDRDIQNRSGIYFMPCSSCKLGYSGQIRSLLKARPDEHPHIVKNVKICSSYIASYCWSYNHYIDFGKICLVSSSISTPHLNFHKTFYALKNSNNLINMNSLPHLISMKPRNCLFKFSYCF